MKTGDRVALMDEHRLPLALGTLSQKAVDGSSLTVAPLAGQADLWASLVSTDVPHHVIDLSLSSSRFVMSGATFTSAHAGLLLQSPNGLVTDVDLIDSAGTAVRFVAGPQDVDFDEFPGAANIRMTGSRIDSANTWDRDNDDLPYGVISIFSAINDTVYYPQLWGVRVVHNTISNGVGPAVLIRGAVGPYLDGNTTINSGAVEIVQGCSVYVLNHTDDEVEVAEVANFSLGCPP
jgi:hypothetical protein